MRLLIHGSADFPSLCFCFLSSTLRQFRLRNNETTNKYLAAERFLGELLFHVQSNAPYKPEVQSIMDPDLKVEESTNTPRQLHWRRGDGILSQGDS